MYQHALPIEAWLIIISFVFRALVKLNNRWMDDVYVLCRVCRGFREAVREMIIQHFQLQRVGHRLTWRGALTVGSAKHFLQHQGYDSGIFVELHGNFTRIYHMKNGRWWNLPLVRKYKRKCLMWYCEHECEHVSGEFLCDEECMADKRYVDSHMTWFDNAQFTSWPTRHLTTTCDEISALVEVAGDEKRCVLSHKQTNYEWWTDPGATFTTLWKDLIPKQREISRQTRITEYFKLSQESH